MKFSPSGLLTPAIIALLSLALLLAACSTMEVATTGAGSSNFDFTRLKSANPAPSTKKHFLITDYGAVADETTMDTAAIQKTIEAAAAAGGGVVEIPKGGFLTGALFFKNGVDLHLDEGAILWGSQDIKDFPTQLTRIEGHFTEWPVALINFTKMDHVRVSGKGQLNGEGQPFYAAFRGARGEGRDTSNLGTPRPRLMLIDRCTDVRVEGISFQDSGFWNLHLYHCSDVTLEGLHINAPGGSPSTDGIDVDSCQALVIRRCQISNNDDDIALKGSKGPHADLDADSPPDENILIEDCEIGNGNGLLTCGSEATIVRNVLVRNCTITGNAKMLTLKLRPDTPQHYSYITFDGIKLNGNGSLIGVAPWTQYFDLAGEPAPPGRKIDHIVIRNVMGSISTFGSLRGNVENAQNGTHADTISDFSLENVNVTMRAAAPLSRGEVANFTYKNVRVNDEPVEAPPATVPPPRTGRGGAPGAAGASGARGSGTNPSPMPTATPAATSAATSI